MRTAWLAVFEQIPININMRCIEILTMFNNIEPADD